jgi:hypothetical protein
MGTVLGVDAGNRASMLARLDTACLPADNPHDFIKMGRALKESALAQSAAADALKDARRP